MMNGMRAWQWAAVLLVAGLVLGTEGAAARSRGTARTGPWRLHVLAYSDTVGVGGYRCPGCDGEYSTADRIVAGLEPIPPLFVIVHAPGDPTKTYWAGIVRRSDTAHPDIRFTINVTEPPPYEVRLETPRPRGYVLCPSSPATRFITQADLDRVGLTSVGDGRDATVRWFFWKSACAHG